MAEVIYFHSVPVILLNMELYDDSDKYLLLGGMNSIVFFYARSFVYLFAN
uniref:Uncharacterized protein n=1 Tax=Rhizophora mucronata TaxID=61149 RepID=A0A2P2Q290_RHIMU